MGKYYVYVVRRDEGTVKFFGSYDDRPEAYRAAQWLNKTMNYKSFVIDADDYKNSNQWWVLFLIALAFAALGFIFGG